MLCRLMFNLWYFRKPPWDSGISPPELLEFIASHPPGKAIDLGCGTGTNVVTLARAGWQVTGVDFAPRAVRTAKAKIKRASISAQAFVDDVTKLEKITGRFDLALDIGCFHSLPAQGKLDYLQQLDRILAPNGFWLMYGFFKSEPSTGLEEQPPRFGPGLTEVEIERISARFSLLSRQNGFDRRERRSAWFLFQRTIREATPPG